MPGRYEVIPEDDKWLWRFRSEGGKLSRDHRSKPLKTRAEALTGAREARGDDREEVFNAAGESAGELVRYRGPEAIVLMRGDGSMHGELEHELRAGGPAQYVDLEPAESSSEAAS